MIDRAYTVAEIDALRAVCQNRYLWGTSSPNWSGTHMSGSYRQEELDKGVEELVRTAMLAGHTAADILAEDARRAAAWNDSTTNTRLDQ